MQKGKAGVWTTVIARKVTGTGGEFIGAVGRGIESANFEKFFASVALAQGSAISMHHRDGTLLARYPDVAENGKHLNGFDTPITTGLYGFLLSPGKSSLAMTTLSRTKGCRFKTSSISPGSIRNPRILTC